MTISIIAAIGKNRELGKNNKLLWHIPEDMKRFKQLTTGHPVIMGRKTFESIGRPLPNRTNIVVTRDKKLTIKECIVVTSLEDAILEAKKFNTNEVFIIGGAQIYIQALPLASKLHLTLVDKEQPDADTFFPEFRNLFTRMVFEEKHLHKSIPFTFTTFER